MVRLLPEQLGALDSMQLMSLDDDGIAPHGTIPNEASSPGISNIECPMDNTDE